jgi:hypothetical protein
MKRDCDISSLSYFLRMIAPTKVAIIDGHAGTPGFATGAPRLLLLKNEKDEKISKLPVCHPERSEGSRFFAATRLRMTLQ